MITPETAVYKNKTQSVVVDMVGECLGLNAVAKTCVRKIVGGGYAVIATNKPKLIKVTESVGHARNYNMMIGR